MATNTGAADNTIGPWTSAPTATAYALNFTPGTTVGATNPCLQETIKSYLYTQYQSDDDLQAFVYAYNTMAQQYVSWFNDVGLPVYTGPLIVGDLLDWVAVGLYGVKRPVLSSGQLRNIGPLNTWALNTIAFNESEVVGEQTFVPVNDDIYKRVLTWKLYKGDGKVINIRWLKRRVLRFLLGVDGTDVNAGDTTGIGVTFSSDTIITVTTVNSEFVNVTPGSLLNTRRMNRAGFNMSRTRAVLHQSLETSVFPGQVNIDVSSDLPNGTIFQEAAEQGVLGLPFQFRTVVNII